ncbi:hypothetical protein KOY48_03130 [Candidatus Minimicrobia naudis]|uniref:Uncharacterized protein n=1 Tax=Candidatus Minimicrobia naudis TaxID=2841263 RepID=A0A8F1SAT2_9BACT|nr:hypothetical protein KOY48_03130 [Candidatus Minimicrobia naudis]
MSEKLLIGRLMPDEIDDKCAESICDMWLRAGNLIGKGQTNPDLTCAVCDINSPDNLRREASRQDSGIYAVKRLGSGGLLAAAIVTIKKGRTAPQYGDSQAGRPMYMEIFGASADAEEAWSDYLRSMVGQARKDFGQSMGSSVTKLCAYASPNANERFPDVVRSINPCTYEKHGGEEGSFGDVGGVPGFYVRHDVEFDVPQTARVLAGLGGAALSLLGNLRGPLGNPVPVRMGSIEEELPNAA